jgi:hypothetical protein
LHRSTRGRCERHLILVAAAVAAFACSGGSVADKIDPGPTDPVVPTPPKPAIALSIDSVVVSLLAGAPSLAQDIDVTAGNATSVTALTVADTSGAAPSGWLSVSLTSTTAPAKLSVRVSPNLAVGRYEATLRVTAANADPRLVRVALVVRPRPRLVVERATLAFSADLGDSIAPQEVAITSVDGAVDNLAVTKTDCGAATSWLTASLSAAKAPATLRLSVTPGSLGVGTHTCAVTVATTQALVDSATQVLRASLTLRGVPRLALPADTITVLATRLNDATPAPVSIRNVGTGTLSGLAAGTIEYEPGASDWLTVAFDSATAPATMTLFASAKVVSAGTFYARVPIQSNAPGSPKVLVVKMLVAPRPSVLMATPNAVNVTVRAGSSVSVTMSVTHSGDASLRVLGFGPPGSGPWQDLFEWWSTWIGCTGAAFVTPCTGQMVFSPPTGTAPGVRTHQISYIAENNMIVPVSIKVTVIR